MRSVELINIRFLIKINSFFLLLFSYYIILKRFLPFHNLTGGDISFLAYRNCAAGSDILLDARDCCNNKYPCNEGEGSCNYDYDCKGGLVCGMNNCDPQKFPSKGTRCCEKGNLVIQAGS